MLYRVPERNPPLHGRIKLFKGQGFDADAQGRM
jgi:hypothetical protein